MRITQISRGGRGAGRGGGRGRGGISASLLTKFPLPPMLLISPFAVAHVDLDDPMSDALYGICATFAESACDLSTVIGCYSDYTEWSHYERRLIPEATFAINPGKPILPFFGGRLNLVRDVEFEILRFLCWHDVGKIAPLSAALWRYLHVPLHAPVCSLRRKYVAGRCRTLTSPLQLLLTLDPVSPLAAFCLQAHDLPDIGCPGGLEVQHCCRDVTYYVPFREDFHDNIVDSATKELVWEGGWGDHVKFVNLDGKHFVVFTKETDCGECDLTETYAVRNPSCGPLPLVSLPNNYRRHILEEKVFNILMFTRRWSQRFMEKAAKLTKIFLEDATDENVSRLLESHELLMQKTAEASELLSLEEEEEGCDKKDEEEVSSMRN